MVTVKYPERHLKLVDAASLKSLSTSYIPHQGQNTLLFLLVRLSDHHKLLSNFENATPTILSRNLAGI